MRATRLLTTIAATLALLLVPAAVQAGARGKPHASPQRSVGVVRSFRAGLLTIRLARGSVKTAEVNDSTELTCQADRPKRTRRRSKTRRPARAAVDVGNVVDPGAGDGTDGDIGDGSATGDDTSDTPGDNAGDDTGDDTGDGVDQQAPASAPRPVKHACSTAALRRGTRVKVAKLGSGPNGAVWTRVVLLRGRH
jgi:hypothetical protein